MEEAALESGELGSSGKPGQRFAAQDNGLICMHAGIARRAGQGKPCTFGSGKKRKVIRRGVQIAHASHARIEEQGDIDVCRLRGQRDDHADLLLRQASETVDPDSRAVGLIEAR